jgi:hypothetical protein
MGSDCAVIRPAPLRASRRSPTAAGQNTGALSKCEVAGKLAAARDRGAIRNQQSDTAIATHVEQAHSPVGARAQFRLRARSHTSRRRESLGETATAVDGWTIGRMLMKSLQRLLVT